MPVFGVNYGHLQTLVRTIDDSAQNVQVQGASSPLH